MKTPTTKGNSAIKYFIAIAIAAAVVLSGCKSIPTTGQRTDVRIDKTFGHYGEGLESNLVLVTMRPKEHLRLTNSYTNSPGELPPKYVQFLDRLSSKYGLKRVADWPLPSIDVQCIIFENKGRQTRESLIAALALESGVESAQAVQTFNVQTADQPKSYPQTYNDPYFSLQHGFHSTQTYLSHFWSRGKGVKVAVVDTGLDNTHPDLASSAENIRNFVDNDEESFRSDIHGTAVGGVIAATANNETGMVGMAPEADLLPIKACWYAKNGNSGAQCNSVTLAKALNYSIKENVDIINLSLSGPPDPLLERLVKAALARNIVVVGAQPLHNEPSFPLSVKGTIAVAMPGADSTLISAPGRRILSTTPNDQYDFYDGSSISAAHISGLAAVIRSLSPTLTPADFLAILKHTADPETGAVNACRAVQALEQRVSGSKANYRCGGKSTLSRRTNTFLH